MASSQDSSQDVLGYKRTTAASAAEKYGGLSELLKDDSEVTP